MVVKPSFDEAAAIVGALVIAAGLAAVLVWLGLRTAEQVGPETTAGEHPAR